MSHRPVTAWLLLAATFVGVLVIYAPGLSYPLIFDDIETLTQNRSIRSLWPPPGPLRPPDDTTMSSRPLVNLSFALNYAVHGLRPTGYRLVNLGLHLVNALLLFDLLRLAVRRIKPGWSAPPPPEVASTLAAAVTLLWAVHPINTEAVIYITQRTELMVAACYLLTLVAAMRGWHVVAVVACAAGMACKEVMVTAPVMAFLFLTLLEQRDGNLTAECAESGEEKTRNANERNSSPSPSSSASSPRPLRSPRLILFHAGLAATWLVLAAVMLTSHRAGSAGFNTGVSPWHYLLTQAGAVVFYLKLCVWPAPLSIAHPWPIVTHVGDALIPGAFVLALLAAGAWLLVRRHWLGLAAAWFFLILAPSSSIVPIVTEVVAERRMYLPSAAVLLVMIVVLVWAAKLGATAWPSSASRVPEVARDPKTRLAKTPSRGPLQLIGAVVLIAAATLGILSLQRIDDYRTHSSIWADVTGHYPHDDAAFYNLGVALRQEGNPGASLVALNRAAELRPDRPIILSGLGDTLKDLGRPDDARAAYERSLQLDPKQAQAHLSLATLHATAGRLDEARTHFEAALVAQPDSAAVHIGLAALLVELAFQRKDAALLEAAIEHGNQATRLDPSSADAWHNRGYALAAAGKLDDAVAAYRLALALQPDWAKALNNLGIALARGGHLVEAADCFEQALRIDPASAEARDNLARVKRMLNPDAPEN